ncbi:peptide/nickel transport system ATP-binding protein [Micromonospora sp. Llam0]|uniref:ABC transporter ATP-binding protein n=1 Tax=Micromonospora sp. Llam0 TaxID=2485143 RepID=UPI000F977B58|nr:ATP-binding cassette domain-containing protein [Micromonospora sp. Llam0]ROO59756.1 peptide/nickel transport system ATP-binding protein [Micromonospora sp. Llam0]
MSAVPPLAEIDGLVIGPVAGGPTIVDGVCLRIASGQVVAMMGRSGSGKSTTALTLLGHVRPGLVRRAGAVRVARCDPFTPAGAAAVRGRHVAYLPQDAAATLNPVRRLASQLNEAIALVGRRTGSRGGTTMAQLLETVWLPADGEFLRRYPHQISGGQAQRVAFAIALAADPDLLVLDEPTAGLDPVLARGVRDLINALTGHRATLLISHDPDLVRAVSDELIVLEAGRPAVTGDPDRVLAAPPPRAAPGTIAVPSDPVLAVRRLGARHGHRAALAEVDFAVPAGGCIAVVGPSGAGKSTLARCLVGLRPYDGAVRLDGALLPAATRRRSPDQRRDLQLVAQDSAGALNPRETVGHALLRPLRQLCGLDPKTARAAADELLDRVHLPAGVAARRPGALSGGERQRVNLARALACRPRVLICDEVTSALDVQTAGTVLALLAELRRDLGLAVVLITHDLAAVAGWTDQVVVLDAGRVVESGPTPVVLGSPRHEITRTLIEAAEGR